MSLTTDIDNKSFFYSTCNESIYQCLIILRIMLRHGVQFIIKDASKKLKTSDRLYAYTLIYHTNCNR